MITTISTVGFQGTLAYPNLETNQYSVFGHKTARLPACHPLTSLAPCLTAHVPTCLPASLSTSTNCCAEYS